MKKFFFFASLAIIQCVLICQDKLYAEVAINDACIQYQTYDPELNENGYFGYIRLRKNDQPLPPDCIEQIALKDSTGSSVTIEAAYEEFEYYRGEWNEARQQAEYHGPEIYTGYAITFPPDTSLSSGNYTFIAATHEGQKIKHTLFYPGKAESPIISKESIDYHWKSDGGLSLNWSKPAGNFDKLKLIFGDDKDRGKLFFVEIPDALNSLTIPPETAALMKELGTGRRVPFVLQTMQYSPGDNMNYSQGITSSSLLLGNITQISDNDFADKHPSLHNGQIAWVATTDYETGGPLINSLKLYYYDGSAAAQIDSFQGHKGFPSLHNGHIAYVKGSISSYFQIKYYDGASISPVSDKIYGNEFLGSQSPKPSLYDGRIAWHEFDGEDYEIYYHDGANTIQITDNNIDDTHPCLHDGQIAWVSDGDIYYGKINNNGKFSSTKITENKNISKHKQPSLHNGQIAWSAHDGMDDEIYYYDGAAITQITDNAFDDRSPCLHNGHIVWHAPKIIGSTNYGDEIFYYDGSAITQITDNEVNDRFPSLHNGHIAWSAHDGADGEIFYYESAFKNESDADNGDNEEEDGGGGEGGCFLKCSF